MAELFLNSAEKNELTEMIEKAEKKYGTEGYSFDPGFATYSCSCTAHKKSCGWDRFLTHTSTCETAGV